MPQPRMDMRMIKDILRLKHEGLSHERVATALSISKGVVAKYVALAALVETAPSLCATLPC